MADAVTSVRAIRAGDTITYNDHFGGDSEGPVSTAILLLHKGTQVKTFNIYTEQVAFTALSDMQ